MTLEELKAMRDRTNEIVRTLENDKTILEREKKALEEKNINDCQAFLDSLKPYAEIVASDKYMCVKDINTFYFGRNYSQITNYGYFWEDDCELRYNKDGFYFLFAGSDVGYSIYITAKEAYISCHNHHCYNDENTIRKFILDNQSEIKRCVELMTERVLETKVQNAKEENDKLFSRISNLS